MGDNFLYLPNSEIDNIIFNIIVSILKENENIEINKLIPILLETKNIKTGKYKNILNYLKINHIGLVQFLKKFSCFIIVRVEGYIYISYKEQENQVINDWIIIENNIKLETI